jgi:hypothetical protein
MSVAQLAVLLRAIHDHSKQYLANSNSCYWYAFTVVEVICSKFSAVQTNGTAFSERGVYKKWKPDIENAIGTVSLLYDAAWGKCTERAQKRAVSPVDFPLVCFTDPEVFNSDRMQYVSTSRMPLPLHQLMRTAKRSGRLKSG